MRKKDLNQLYHIKAEIEDLSDWIETLDRKLEAVSGGLSVTGVKTDAKQTMREIEAELMDQRTILTKFQKQREQVKNELLLWIGEIEDAQIRRIMHYRHIDLCTWRGISTRMCGSPGHEDSYRMMHDRYLKENGIK